jgi:hypothetical protein
MIAMLRFKAFSIIRFLILGSLFLFSPLHAQDLQQWMPNVGDRFVYDSAYTYSGQNGPLSQGVSYSGHDTVIMEIIANDSLFFQDTTWRVVIANNTYSNGAPSSDESFYFHVGRDINSNHSLMIDKNEPPGILPSVFDFSDSKDSQTEYDSGQITTFSSDTGASGAGGPLQYGYDSEVAVYSPNLHWFLYLADNFFSNTHFDVWSHNVYTMSLISVNVSRVDSSLSGISKFEIQFSNGALQLVSNNLEPLSLRLLDLLGRPIRSWQMPADAGERQITLNVADVPSGVYFLRISAPGVEEIRKVVIVH